MIHLQEMKVLVEWHQIFLKKNKIKHVQGYGRLLGGGRVEVDSDGDKTTLEGDHVILATGSRPRNLPTRRMDEDRIWSSTGALMQTEAPESLLIVGAGAIGMEFADVYDSYGTEVTIVEALDRILEVVDRDHHVHEREQAARDFGDDRHRN